MQIKEKVAAVPRLWSPLIMASPLCPGCHHGIISALIAHVVEELGIEDRSIVVGGAGCSALAMAGFPLDRTWGAHGRPPDIATGIKRVRPDAIVFTCQGDGDLLAIGSDPLMGVLTRAEQLTIIMFNNVNFGTTGGQLAPTTMMGQVTPTTPKGRRPQEGFPVHAAEMIATFRGVSYSARGAVNTPAHYTMARRYLKTAFQKQMDGAGFSFVEMLSACPVQWRMTPEQSLKRLEDMVAEFPLGEFKNIDRVE